MRWRSSSCSNASFMPRVFAPPQPKHGFSGFGSSFMALLGRSDQFALHHSSRLAGNENAVTLAASANKSASRRSLVSNQVIPAQALLPERAQTAMRRTRDGIFVNPCRGSEKARNVVAIRTRWTARYNQPARLHPADLCKVWSNGSQGVFTIDLNQIVEPAPPYVSY